MRGKQREEKVQVKQNDFEPPSSHKGSCHDGNGIFVCKGLGCAGFASQGAGILATSARF